MAQKKEITVAVAKVPLERTLVKKVGLANGTGDWVLNVTGVNMPRELILAVLLKVTVVERAHVSVLRDAKILHLRFERVKTLFRGLVFFPLAEDFWRDLQSPAG